MMEYTENQKNIAKLLLSQPLTIEELRQRSGLTADALNEELKGLIKLKLVERAGEKYKLIKYIEERVKEKALIENNYVFKMIIEGISQSKEALAKQMEVLESKLKAEKINILGFEKGDVQEIDKNYTSFFDMEVGVSSFSDIIYLIINYGPSSIDILEPHEFRLSMNETQLFLNEVASAVHYYISLIIQQQQKLIELQRKNLTKEPEKEGIRTDDENPIDS